MTPFHRVDERPHEPGPSPWWTESWDIEFVAPDGALGGFVHLARMPNQRRVWCWVYVLRADGTVVVRDHDVPLSSAHPLLARSEGLWCELVCELPFTHWSIGVEAFGVRLDDPLDGLRGEIGTRIPVGLELEWETDPPNVADPADAAGVPSGAGYERAGRVRGDVLLGDEVIAFDGAGVLRHVWGELDRPDAWRGAWCAWTDGGWSFHGDVPSGPGTRAVFDAVIPLTPAPLMAGAVLTRSLIAVSDAGARIGFGMRTVVQVAPD